MLVATPFLPMTMPIRTALTLASIMPALMSGLNTLLYYGVKAEVLAAASVSAIQGDCFTANASHFMLEMDVCLGDSTASICYLARGL